MAKKTLNLVFSEEFHNILASEAHKHGMNMTGFIKYLVIKNIVDKEDYKTIIEDGGMKDGTK